MYYTLYFLYTIIYSSLSFSYTCSYTMYFSYTVLSYCTFSSYTVILYFTSCSYNCLYFHRITVLCFSYHVFYTCHFLLGFMSSNALEADTRNYKGPKALYSLYETVVYKGPKALLSLYETMIYVCMTQTGPL